MRATKVWGTMCFVGERNDVTIDVSPDMLRKQLTIDRVVDLLADRPGRMRPVHRRPQDRRRCSCSPIRWKLDQADEAYKLFDTQTTGKGVFLM